MKNYVVIGASTGIGASLANQLANEGNRVYGTFNAHPREGQQNTLSYHALNILDEELDLSFVPDVVDGIAYCPGSINLRPFARIKAEAFMRDLQLQFVGAVRVIQTLLSKLKQSEQAAIVLFSTVAVQQGFPFHTQVSASKGAIEGFSRALAAELAPKVRVNCIAPSLTQTPLAAKLLSSEEKIAVNAQRHPLKQIGKPEDIAEMAAFLLSDKASWMTGQIIHIDGGMSRIKN